MLKKVKALLKESENREMFLRRLDSFLSPLDPRYQLIVNAYDDSKDAFRKKKRKTGERYFEHLRAVFLIQFDYLYIRDPDILIAGLLHDIVEDIPSWSIERVKNKYGVRVAMLVDYSSKPRKKVCPNEEKRLIIFRNRFEFAPRDLWKIKLPDRLHNLLCMWIMSQEKIAFKIEETEKYYLPYAREHIILVHELEEAIKELKKKL